MLRQRGDQGFLFTLGLADLGVTAIAWLLAYAIRLHSGWFPLVDGDMQIPPFWWCVRSLPIILLAAAFSYRAIGIYQLGQRWPLHAEVLRIAQAVALLILLTAASTFFVRNPYESRLATVLFGGICFVGMLAVRRGMALYFRLRRRQGLVRGRALIVGSGRAARRVEQALRRNNWIGLQPIGFVDDDPARAPLTVGTVDDLPELIEQHDVQYVFVALPFARFAESRRVYRLLADSLVEIRLVPDVPRLQAAGLGVSYLDGHPVMAFQDGQRRYIDVVAKRLMDVTLSAIGLLALSPLLAAVAVFVKLSSPGPILYRQERMGLNGHRFWMLKFRTMRTDAESTTGPVWAKQHDDRRTPLGTFLRKTSIDELPQLWNVLVGDMSLVGPRPERPYFIGQFRHTIPRYMRRHAMKAGITGWAQINGWRGNTSLRKRVQYDLYYITHWSLWLDVRILFLTVSRVLRDRNAY